MVNGILRRTTLIASDAAATADFYEAIFGWSRWYDNDVAVDRRFPPAAPHDAIAQIIIMQCEDPDIGMLGIMEYKDADLPVHVDPARDKLGVGDIVLMVGTDDMDAVFANALSVGARVVSEPIDWAVPTHDGGGEIKLTTMSMFDPNGYYIEVSHRHPPEAD